MQMFSTVFELTRRTLFINCPLGTAWGERLVSGCTPMCQHPENRRWGWSVEEGELLLYLGPLHLILTPPNRTSAQVQ